MDSIIAHEALIPNPGLKAFGPFIGNWVTVGHHPMLPGKTLHGRASIQWHEGGAFVVVRSETEEPEIPSGIAIFGNDDDAGTLTMVYFDERRVARRYEAELNGNVLRWWRNTPTFSQRFTITVDAGSGTMQGAGEMSKDGGEWGPDLGMTYIRMK